MAEGNGLLNRRRVTPTAGSNPALSAIIFLPVGDEFGIYFVIEFFDFPNRASLSLTLSHQNGEESLKCINEKFQYYYLESLYF